MSIGDGTRSTAEALEDRVPGTRVVTSRGRAWNDLLVQVFRRDPHQERLLVPAVPEPLIVWVLSGAATVEERELGGPWRSSRVTRGDFFLAHAPAPYELRWTSEDEEPFEVMHLYLGQPLLARAAGEVFDGAGDVAFREVSGGRDTLLSSLLEPLWRELMSAREASAIFVQGLAQALCVHLLRHYGTPSRAPARPRGGLPAFKLRQATEHLEARLDREFELAPLAHAVGLSEFHFCRAFKRSTGFPPSRYFIRLRMERARRLLRETSRPVIEIALDVGYTSASHFAQVFRREVGVSPSDYREGT